MEGERERILSVLVLPLGSKQIHFVFEDTEIDNFRHSILQMKRNTRYVISLTDPVIWS